MTFMFPGQSYDLIKRTPNSLYQLISDFSTSRNAERVAYAERIIDILQSKPALTNSIFKRIYMYSIERTVKETLKQISSLYAPTTLENSSDHERNYKIRRTIIRLLDFVLIEMGRHPSVRTDNYPLNMIDPILPYMLQFVTSSDVPIRNKAARILHEITSISMIEYAPTLLSVDCAALQADISLRGPHEWEKSPINMAAALNLIGCISSLFVDADVSSPCIETVKLLIRIASSLLTSEEALQNVANCLPLTLLVTSLTAAPPTHHLPILNIYLEFCDNCHPIIDVQESFLTRLLAVFPPNTRLDDPLTVVLLLLLTSLASPDSLWDPLLNCLSNSEHPSRLALCLLASIKPDLTRTPTLTLRPQVVPRIARLLLQDLDEQTQTVLICLLGQNADRSNGDGLEENEAQQIVEKLLEIEQRHPLHTDIQETEKTTTDGTTLSPLVDGRGEAASSAGKETNVNELADVWRVMRMAVSSLADSPSGLERLHVLYPLIFLQMKERGSTLLCKDKRAEQTREDLLPALVRVCSELTPLLRTVDCFPLVHLVSSFLHLMPQPTNRRQQQIPIGYDQPDDLDLIELPDCYVRMKEFFLRVDEVTQGLDGYDITHHTIFPPSSTEPSTADADCVISRPLTLLKIFVDFEVKCIGVREAALLQQNNSTAPDQTRRQLLLHLLSAMNRTNDFDPSAVCGVLLSFPRLPHGTTQLVNSLKDTIIVAHNPSPPVCAKEICRLLTLILMRAAPNEADSEEKWRVVLHEEGSEDMLNVILKQSLSEVGKRNGMNCTVASFIFEPSTILGITTPAHIPPVIRGI
ncbi:hypothetical protein BLNAU_3985 [Blattamonas nauphoetae]|uniref:Uncharacterized protein n=1 Tax=Blattamonas nauphoetae TaxID=2049346 RepID=A0ABQ9YAT7_9EUKA|nr:hypothetical protein BLNAU_3985 [Blattamonas nauphoetae]